MKVVSCRSFSVFSFAETDQSIVSIFVSFIFRLTEFIFKSLKSISIFGKDFWEMFLEKIDQSHKCSSSNAWAKFQYDIHEKGSNEGFWPSNKENISRENEIDLGFHEKTSKRFYLNDLRISRISREKLARHQKQFPIVFTGKKFF